MQRQTTLSLWCERIIEGGWLLALTLIPIYFNLLSARHFEPDKATTLRAIVLVMVAAGLVRALEHLSNTPSTSAPPAGADQPAADHPELWKRFSNIPLAVPALVYALVFVATTITSVVPLSSFLGSYQRLQGTYTHLSYIGLFAMVIATLRRREQLERVVIVSLLAGLTVASYGLIQHFQLDPLPWRGDVITRVASTMGNSIFVAAYMIMIAPLALYRLVVGAYEAQRAPASTNPSTDALWGLAYGFLIGGTLAFLLAIIKFSAVIRTIDMRYWWVFPGAIIVTTALWTLATVGVERSNRRVPLWPGLIFLTYLLMFGFVFAGSRSVQAFDESIVRGLNWWIWLWMSLGAVTAFYGLALMLPKRPTEASRLWFILQTIGAALILLALLSAIFFTQSRGPWIGMGFGLFAFFSLLLWQAIRRAQVQEKLALARGLRITLVSWVAITLVSGGFLIVFNISNAPIFQQLRDVPYVGRMGRLLEVNEGTGLVRRLIWIGDEHAGGAVELIQSDWVRMFIGWGPESMFVAFNKFYPPSLANVEARGASPDRSHQAILDQLVTRGVIGLISYIFVLISFFVLTWHLIRRSDDWRWQVFFIAMFSIVLSHFAEGLTGIPIVSTLMMLWMAMGLTVTGGALAGHYTLGGAATPSANAESESTPTIPTEATAKRAKTKGGRRGSVARGAAKVARTTSARPRGRQQTPAIAIVVYVLLFGLALAGGWWLNLRLVYADMLFQEGQSRTENPQSGFQELVRGADDYLATIRRNPYEDFYYLNLGRTLMNLAQQRQAQGTSIGAPKTDVDANDLLRLDSSGAVETFILERSPIELLSYAEAVLQNARELNPLNKDHYANLGRLNSFWYGWTQDEERLRASLEWFEKATEVAPQDVTLINERASAISQMGRYMELSGDAEGAQQYYAQAEELLLHSKELDPKYVNTDVRLADLYRIQEQMAEAVDRYINIVRQSPHQLDASIEQIADALNGQPDLLRTLRDAYNDVAGDDALLFAISGLLSVRAGEMDQAVSAYARATALQPESIEYHRNYTLVLSDTQRYDQALVEAQATLELLQRQTGRENEQAQMQGLIAFLQQQSAGGQ